MVVERSLAPGDSVVLEMKYGGYIDQDVYQVDIDDDRYFAPRRQTRWVERLGKGSAFVSGNYTLLIPEVKRDGFHGLHLAREESQGADGVVARRDGKAARRGDVSQFASINRIVTLHG